MKRNLAYLLRPIYMEYLYVEFVCKCIHLYFTYILDGAGMLLLTMGTRQAVRFIPALVVTEGEIDTALQIFEGAVAEALA